LLVVFLSILAAAFSMMTPGAPESFVNSSKATNMQSLCFPKIEQV
jgi:hypothetical protein